ncbi:MAG TPA: HNH endonuclease [Methylosinus sp.]|jgi:5-methylcytosine-specific restriction endonuclease McrA|uniref:HNH endonuclease n=1 Tax=Methylosinus sp. TaxID=427 RepID=UPI002F933A3B
MGVMKKYRRHSEKITRSARWKSLRFIVLRRDGFKCVTPECGARGALEVDHIKPVRTHPELAFDLSNLQSLCVACHSRKTRLEIGLGEIDPRKEAWKQLVKDIKCSKV